MENKYLLLSITIILVSSLIVYPIQHVYADDFMITEDCTLQGWMVTITDDEGNPLKNVKVMTLKKMSATSGGEIFSTDENGTAVIPFSSITGFVKVSKGGYNDQKFAIVCNPSTSYTIKTESNFLTYEDPVYGIKIDYPSNWIIDTSDPNFHVKLVSPQESTQDFFADSVLVIVQSVEFTHPTDFASAVISSLDLNQPNFNLIENFQTSIGGHLAQRVTFTGILPGNLEFQDTAYFTIVDNLGYTIIFEVESQKSSKYSPIFEKMIESVEIQSDTTSSITPNVPPIMPQMISEKYINTDVGMEITFPTELSGFEITFPKDADYSELPPELQGMAEIYSGMTMVMMLPSEFDPTENVEILTLTVMDISSIENFSEFISQTVNASASQPTSDIQGLESQLECDISNQTILEINEMKALKINSECKDPIQNMKITMSLYMFMTPEYVVSPMYMITHETDKKSDLSIFEDSLETIKIENTLDISDPNIYAELFGLKVTKENALIENKPHEIHIVSDSTITNFAFDENNQEISFELEEKDVTLGSTEVYLNDVLKAPFVVNVDGNAYDTFMITEDKTTEQTSISISYLNPVNNITIKGNNENKLSNTQIPDWIKNNAKWWVEGTIDDKAFVGGIQFLIKEGLIQIPETIPSTTDDSQEIPQWIKNNADWWSQGLISDEDFIKGIQFMVENGIIAV